MVVATPEIPDSTGPQTGTEYKVNIDADGKVDSRLAWAFAPHEQSTLDMTVRLEAGWVPKIAALPTEVAAQSTGTITAPSTNPRKDIVHIDQATGVVGVATGAENASPVDPAVPAGKIAVARITLATSTTTITNSILDDLRNIGATNLVDDLTPQLGGVLDTNSKAIDESEGAAVASAATTDIWATDGNTVHVTGTVTITSLGTAPRAGAWRKVIFDGILTLTHGANLNLPGSANTTTAAGDFAFVYADTTTQLDVLYFKADGTAVVAAATAGHVVQVVNTQTGAVATGTTAIPFDDTIPQNTEGDEYMTLSITPTSATNKLVIGVEWTGSNSSGNNHITSALFQDAIASALAVGNDVYVNANNVMASNFSHFMTAGTTSAIAFKVRIGASSGTFTFNGQIAARKFGGALSSSITIWEIEV